MKKNKGIILITTLIFLLILSMVAYQALEHELLEKKLYQTLQREKSAYTKAKSALQSGESLLKTNCNNPERCYIVEPLKTTPPQYQITAKSTQGDISVILQSVCEKTPSSDKCLRLSWEQLTTN